LRCSDLTETSRDDDTGVAMITLRFDTQMLARVDVAAKRLRMSRTAWLHRGSRAVEGPPMIPPTPRRQELSRHCHNRQLTAPSLVMGRPPRSVGPDTSGGAERWVKEWDIAGRFAAHREANDLYCGGLRDLIDHQPARRDCGHDWPSPDPLSLCVEPIVEMRAALPRGPACRCLYRWRGRLREPERGLSRPSPEEPTCHRPSLAPPRPSLAWVGDGANRLRLEH
jgi:hypothetical protein